MDLSANTSLDFAALNVLLSGDVLEVTAPLEVLLPPGTFPVGTDPLTVSTPARLLGSGYYSGAVGGGSGRRRRLQDGSQRTTFDCQGSAFGAVLIKAWRVDLVGIDFVNCLGAAVDVRVPHWSHEEPPPGQAAAGAQLPWQWLTPDVAVEDCRFTNNTALYVSGVRGGRTRGRGGGGWLGTRLRLCTWLLEKRWIAGGGGGGG